MAHPELSRLLFEKDVAVLTPDFERSLRLVVHSREFPVLDVTVEHTKPVRFRFGCDNFDDQPPSITLLNTDASPYSGGALPGGVLHPGPHPSTGRPFVCMRGSREYHTHPSHMNDSWSAYRGQDGMNVVGILMQLVHYWRKHVR